MKSTQEKYPTCAERIEERKKSLLSDAYRVQAIKETYDVDGRFEDILTRETLEVTGKKTVDVYTDEVEKVEWDILLSWGGPSDGFKVFCDDSGDITGGEYYFRDWWDGAESHLSTEDVWALISLFDVYLEGVM